MPVHICLGNSWSTSFGWYLQQRQCPKCKYNNISHLSYYILVSKPHFALHILILRLGYYVWCIIYELKWWLDKKFRAAYVLSHLLKGNTNLIEYLHSSSFLFVFEKIDFIYICLTYMIIIMAFFVVLRNAVLFPLK